MHEIQKFFSYNRNFLILGVLLVSLPVLLLLSQTTQVFAPRASGNAPGVTSIVVGNSNSRTTPNLPGTQITSTVSLTGDGKHFDAYYIDADAHPHPTFSDSFTPIGELTGRPPGSYPWVVPATPGHYFFAVNAHTSIDHDDGNDWNQSATVPDTGCGWDGKVYTGPPPLQTDGTTCQNAGLKEFWVGTPSMFSPSPSAQAAQSSIAPRPPFPSPFLTTNQQADCIITDLNCLSKDPAKLTGQLYNVGLGLVGGVGILFMIMGAYMVLSSQGDPTKVSKGKEYITYAIIGILLALFGYGFYQIVAVDVLHLPGFSN